MPDILINGNSTLSGIQEDELIDVKIMCKRVGPLSEKNYCWYKCINYDSGISGDDLWESSRLFYERKQRTMNFEKHNKFLEEETENLIKMHWPFINVIARQILAKKDMTIGEIINLWEKFL